MTILFLAAALALQPTVEAAPVSRGSTLFAVDAQTQQRYPTVRVPYRPDEVCYEWVLFFEPENRTINVREEVELPSPPPSWGDAPGLGATISKDGRTAISQVADSLDDSQVSRRWCVGEGDPLGAYRVRVFHNDRLLETFEFDLVADTE